MRLIKHKLAAATAVAAALSLVAAPAAAAQLPRVAGQGQPWNAEALDVEGHGHRGHHGGWHDDDDWDIDGDDVVAGALILGGIAAIVGIANSAKHRSPPPPEPYPDPEPYPEDAGYQAPVSEPAYRSGGMADAVDRCVAEIQVSAGRVSTVDAASRNAAGWRVSGQLEDGAGYWCAIDNSGQISEIGGSGIALGEPVAQNQHDDAYYTRARASKAAAASDGELGEGAGYETAQAEF